MFICVQHSKNMIAQEREIQMLLWTVLCSSHKEPSGEKLIIKISNYIHSLNYHDMQAIVMSCNAWNANLQLKISRTKHQNKKMKSIHTKFILNWKLLNEQFSLLCSHWNRKLGTNKFNHYYGNKRQCTETHLLKRWLLNRDIL